MKTLIKSLFYSLAVLLFVTSCNRDFDAPPFNEPKYDGRANLTIQGLKELFANTSQDQPTEVEVDYVVRGYVIGNDISGNIYKQIYIQDQTGGISIGIEENGLSGKYRVGQELFVELHGLSIVKYGGELQIGYAGTNANRIPADEYENFLFHNGFPDSKNVSPKVVTIRELTDADVNTLVRINNVHFPDGGVLRFAEGTTTTNRVLRDANNNAIDVRTSGYSDFANDTLPVGTGDIVGILGRFNGSWQFTLRDNSATQDLINFSPGSVNPEPEPEPEEGVVYSETFGSQALPTDAQIAEYTGYDNSSPVSYSGSGIIRNRTAFSNHLWMGANRDAVFTITGINTAGQTNVTLSYDITFNIYEPTDAANVNTVRVSYNGTQLPVPSVILDRAGGYNASYYTVTLDISNLEMRDNSTVEFTSAASENLLGIRLDNIKITSGQ